MWYRQKENVAPGNTPRSFLKFKILIMENAVLDDLYTELERVSGMTEQQVMVAYNADSKGEILALINAEIESTLKEQYEENDYDEGMDYDELCRVQGLSRY